MLCPFNKHNDSIAILDFGSQYAQIIATACVKHRSIRAIPVDAPRKNFPSSPKASSSLAAEIRVRRGAPHNVHPRIRLPIFGICYGMQALTHALGGQVTHLREYGPQSNPLILLSNLSSVDVSR